MAKRKRQKTLGKLSPEAAPRLDQAVRELIGRSPEEAPLDLFESVTKDLEADKAALLEFLAGYRSEEVLTFLHRLLPVLTDKALVKAAKRAVYRLEQSGVQASEEVKPSKKSILRPLPAKQAQAYICPYEVFAVRTGLLALPAPGGGFNVALFLVSQVEGFLDLKTMHLSGGQLKGVLQSFDEENFGEMIKIPAGHGRFILAEAAARTRDQGREIPKEYEEFAALPAQPSMPDRPAIYEYLTPDEIMAGMDLERVAEELLKHELFTGFILADELTSYFEHLDELEDSQLVLSENQKEEQREVLFQQAKARIFDGPKRAVIKRQLEETALLLWQKGEKILAIAALATALDLVREDSFLRPHYFTQAMLRRSIDLVYDEADRMEADERRSRRIILPDLGLGRRGWED